MSISNEELRVKCERAMEPRGNMTDSVQWVMSCFRKNEEFRQAAHPAKVKELLDHIAQLEKSRESLIEQRDYWHKLYVKASTQEAG